MTPTTKRGQRRAGAAKATLLALAVLTPTLGLLVHGIADQPLATKLSLAQKIQSAFVFSGLPGVVVFASVGARLARKASMQTLAQAMRIGATKGGLIGLGLELLVAIPTGALPHSVTGWIPLLAAGAAAGAFVGAVAAAWINASTRKREAGYEAAP